MIRFAGIMFLLAIQVVFDKCAPPQDTNWSIFYYAGVYLSLLTIAIDAYMDEYNKIIKLSYIPIAFIFSIWIYLNLLQINKPYELYMISVNEKVTNIIIYTLILIALSIICAGFWYKFFKKRGKHGY
jgi:hypothetical protein